MSAATPVRTGFVTIVGRPNVGKSTLLNRILGTKVTIVSDKPQTTRTQVRGVLDRPDAQVVFVDTPGIHKPRTALGTRLNHTATSSVAGVDLTCFVIDATGPIGKGDRFVAERLDPASTILVVNKCDAARPETVVAQLGVAGGWEMADYYPLSAVTGEGVDALVNGLVARLPEGPKYYPEGQITDIPEALWVAELVREQLLAVAQAELPHSIATRVTEWEWPYVRCEILVERESQKGIVIGHKGGVLKQVGQAARAQMAPGAYLDLHVTVVKNWQRREDHLDRLGY